MEGMYVFCKDEKEIYCQDIGLEQVCLFFLNEYIQIIIKIIIKNLGIYTYNALLYVFYVQSVCTFTMLIDHFVSVNLIDYRYV